MRKIYNHGEFSIGYKPENFIEDNIDSIVRNPLILKTLFLSDNVETYGSGLKRVYDECKINNVLIEYVLSREGFSFIFIRNVVNDVVNYVVNVVVNNVVNNVVNDVVNGVVNKELSNDEELVLRLLKENPYLTSSKIAELINRNSRISSKKDKFENIRNVLRDIIHLKKQFLRGGTYSPTLVQFYQKSIEMEGKYELR